MLRFLILFIGVPLVELMLLIQIGARIGLLGTLALILVTGVLGASLARQQGLGVLARLQQETAQGQMPTRTMLEGVVILIAGIVLLTPGFLTDIFGLLCLIPFTRRFVLDGLERATERAIRERRLQVHTSFGQAWTQRTENVKDADFVVHEERQVEGEGTDSGRGV